jgi:NDP-sugar pyrophosphorylase family protein
MASEGMFKNMIKIICKRNFFIFNIDILNDLKYIKKLKKNNSNLKEKQIKPRYLDTVVYNDWSHHIWCFLILFNLSPL